MSNTIISLCGVTIRYPDSSSFNNIDFIIKKGEHTAIVGQNEPLKNALLDALAGRIPVLRGKTSFPLLEEYAEKHPGEQLQMSPRRLIAYVSSRHNFRNRSNTSDFYYQQRFNSSDSENSLKVKVYLDSIKVPDLKSEWKLPQTIEKLKLHHLLDEELIKLSNGETKRVLIAAALLKNPLLLLLNNPLTGLDPESRKDISKIIDQLAQAGITIVMTALANEIPACITHVAIVDKNVTAVARTEFNLVDLKLPEVIVIDKNELESLLSINTLPAYDNIVLMKNVTIRYGDKIILDHVNWTVKQGERWELSGHNGAGKSTLLSLINGDNPQAFANDIILFDRKKGSGESIWDIKKKTGFFSSELYQYFPVDTLCLHAVESGFYDTIGLFRPSHPKTSSVALRWMKLLRVDHVAGKLLKNVSAVNQRLCLLARALVKSPVLLILDEPTQGFDEYQRGHFKELINTICKFRAITIIYVSHYKEEIPECISKNITLQNGKQI